MLKINNLTKVYDKKTVVSGVSFTVGRGEAFALLGSNGAGKTTTIRMMRWNYFLLRKTYSS